MTQTTIKRQVAKTPQTLNINIKLDVPDFAKNKIFKTKPGKVKSGISSYSNTIFLPGVSDASPPIGGSKKGAIKKSSAQAEDISTSFSTGITPPVDPNVLVELRTYNAYHDRSIRLKVMATCGMGHDIRPFDTKLENFENAPQYKIIKDFTDNPNEQGERFKDIILAYADDFYTFFHSYLEVVPNAKGEIKEIYNMPAVYVRVKKPNQYIKFIQRINAKETEFSLFTRDPKTNSYSKPKDGSNLVLWLKDYYSKSKFYGIPDYFSAVADITLDRSAVEYNINRFKNGLMIDFIIVVEGGDVDAKVLEDINNFLTKNYQGLLNAGKALYLNSDSPEVKIRIEKVSAEIRDASFLRQREFSRDVVMAAHGTNAKVLGLQTPGQLGGGEGDMQFRLLEELIIKPDRLRFQDKINYLIKYGLGVDKFFIELRELNVDSWKDLVNTFNTATFLADSEKRIGTGYGAEMPADANDNFTVAQRLERMKKDLALMRKAAEEIKKSVA